MSVCTFAYMKKMIIAIDGYSSCGKSTLAKQLAKELGYIYIDTGAMYRAITLYFLRNGVDLSEVDQVKRALMQIHLQFKKNINSGVSDMYLNGENVEGVIRGMEVAGHVSAVAANPLVREFAVEQQRKMGGEKGVVMDGRDIGTVVFPEAEVKLFMTADANERAKRRYLELKEHQPGIQFDEILANLLLRDQIDSSRNSSPLRKAEDAILIDTTNLSRQEQLELALRAVNSASA